MIYNQLAIPERICEDWCAGVVHKVRKSIDNKRATVANAIKHEVMQKYIAKFSIHVFQLTILILCIVLQV